jgi:uncharacterized protein (DUF1800 family)
MRSWFRAAIGGGALAFGLLAASSHAAELSPREQVLHVLNRVAYGPSPEDLERANRIGARAYIEEQLRPERLPLPAATAERLARLPTLGKSPGDLILGFRDANRAVANKEDEGKAQRREFLREVTEDTGEARLVRAVRSPRQLEEVMVDFWFNHFNVFQGKGLVQVLVARYEEEAIRPHALGRFRDLLGATARSPAMLFYLDNWLSTAPGFRPVVSRADAPPASGLNENYARELMELHTLGVDGGYTQKDVTELARMFTGWTFDPRSGTFAYVDRRHDAGDKLWLGRRVAAGGQQEGEFALDVLAEAPATARHVSFKLAQYFVADEPPPALVARMAERFRQTHGDIREVLATLFASAEFWDASHYGRKFKTPYQYVVSSLRAAQVDVAQVRPVLGVLRQLGMPLYGCPTPDGYKNTEAAWLNPDALTRRIGFATALAAGRLPQAGAPRAAPLDAHHLGTTMDGLLAERTRAVIAGSPPQLHAALMLGSPDFMRR